MTRQAQATNYDDKLLFRETFNSEQSVRRNGGTPSNVDFSNGVISSTTESSSQIIYSKEKKYVDSFSIRLKINISSNENSEIIRSDDSNNARVFYNANGLGFWATGGFKGYYNGSALKLDEDIELVFTTGPTETVYYINGVAVYTDDAETVPTQIGNWYVGDFGDYFNFTSNLIEVYEGTLSAEEVSNLHNNSRYVDPNLSKIREQYDDNIVSNGTFDNTSDWTLESGWSISDGKLRALNVSGNRVTQSIPSAIDIKYKISFDTVIDKGRLNVFLGSNAGDDRVANLSESGSYEFEFYITNANDTLYFYGFEDYTGTVDNVVVQESVKGTSLETIFDFDAKRGVIQDRQGNPLTITDVDVERHGSIYSPVFNGDTSLVNAGQFDDLTGDITILAWINPYSYGEGGSGRLLDNGSLTVFINSADDSIYLNSSVNTKSTPIEYREIVCIAITRTSSGLTNFYINGELTSANKDSGTPSAGNDVIIGNRTDGSRAFDGLIPKLKIVKGIMSQEQISQFYTSTKRFYS